MQSTVPFGIIHTMKKLFSDMVRRARSFRLEWKPFLHLLLIMLCATMLSAVLQTFFIQPNNVSILYSLAVVAVACITPGYFYGIAASFISVFGINYFFTSPFWALNFSQTGYPITFLTLLFASITTSTLVTGYRERREAMMEAEAEKLRGNLLRAISHDLRTPLTAISGSSATLIQDEGGSITSEDRAALLGDIYENAQWLIRMVENLLSVTRIDGGGAPIQKTPDMAEEVAAQAMAQIRRRFPGQALHIQAPEEALLVPMDGTLISQVLINLIENAIFHSGVEAPVEIEIQKEGSFAVFRVRDHGRGVDAARMQRLFAGHIDAARAGDQSRGIGIGLSICAAIVRAHGGSMDVLNMPDGGAQFSFRLPLA